MVEDETTEICRKKKVRVRRTPRKSQKGTKLMGQEGLLRTGKKFTAHRGQLLLSGRIMMHTL